MEVCDLDSEGKTHRHSYSIKTQASKLIDGARKLTETRIVRSQFIEVCCRLLSRVSRINTQVPIYVTPEY